MAAVIVGFEAAWRFFGGVFRTVIPDNLSAVVDKADPTEPRLNQAFVEYAQARGFLIDPARVRHPQDKPRVERMVNYVRRSFFAGETFVDLADAQRRAEVWCCSTAGLRIHGTTACRPVEHFALEEAPRLLPAPTEPYDLPIYATAKVHRDHHIEVAKAVYSIPGGLIGQRVNIRADRQLVKVFHRAGWSRPIPASHRAGAPPTPTTCRPRRRSTPCGTSTASWPWPPPTARPSAPTPRSCSTIPCPGPRCARSMPWLGLVKKWGADRVDAACARAAEAEAFRVSLIGRMLERAAETAPPETFRQQSLLPGRFARPASDFATGKEASA